MKLWGVLFILLVAARATAAKESELNTDVGAQGPRTTAAAELRLNTSRPGNIFYTGEQIRLIISGDAGTEWEIVDFDGKTVAEGRAASEPIVLRPQPTGIYYVRKKGDTNIGPPTSFCVVRKLPTKGRKGSPFGLNGGALFHIGLERVDIEGKRNLDVCRAIGAPWGRNDFWWGVIEPEKGRFDWRLADKTVQHYNEHGIELLAILCYNSAWHVRSPDNDEEAANFAGYAREMVARYGDRVAAWEVWNEPNISIFWTPEPKVEDYVRLLKLTYSAIKEVHPDCLVAGMITAGPDVGFIRKALELGAGGSFDILSVHHYFWDEDSFLRDIRALKALLEEFKLKKPIWITEIGWPTGKKWMSERDQARMLLRIFALALSQGIERLFYFNSQDWVGWESEDWSGRTGLWEGDSPKAAAPAYNTLISVLEGARPAGELKMPTGAYAPLFRKGKELIAVVWSAGGDKEIEIRTKAKKVTFVDMMGRRRQIDAKKGRIRMHLDGSPLFIHGLQDSDEIVPTEGNI